MLAGLSGWADNVSSDEALQQAVQFLNRQNIVSNNGKMHLPNKSQTLSLAKDAGSYYVFNVGQNEGFVMVSGDDRTPAILGYADEGTFDTATMPENMKAWLQDYAKQIDFLNSHPQARVYKAQLNEHQAIKPLLRTTWNQGWPYNNFCPNDENGRSVTGCVATAMAQVINYHKHPSQTTNTIPAYNTNTKGIALEEIGITHIDWANILNNYKGNENDAQQSAVAMLMKLCGCSVYMDYSSTASAAYSGNVDTALKNYFDYDASTRYESRGDYRANEWDEMIYSELAQKRPVYYSGQSTGGGHAFVVDGYDKEGLYHLNWGWGGSCDGYFLLSILDPDSNSGIGASSSSDGYSYGQDAVVGARPNTGMPYDDVNMRLYGISSNQTVISKFNRVFHVTADISGIYSAASDTRTMDVGLGIFDNEGQMLYAEYNWDGELYAGWGWANCSMEADIPSLPNGTYEITTVCRETGTDTWKRTLGGNQYFLTAIINNNTMTIQSTDVNIDATIAVTGNLVAGHEQTVTTTIVNNGTRYKETLMLRVDGKEVGGRIVEVDAGEAETFDMIFTPETAGTQKVQIGFTTWTYLEEKGDWQEDFNEVASTTVTFQEPKSYDLSFSNGSVTNANGMDITDPIAHLRMTVKNNSSYAYNDIIRTYSYKQVGETFSYQTEVNTQLELAANESKTIDVDIPLSSDGYYWFITLYKNNGAFVGINDFDRRYAELFGYNVYIENTIEVEIPVYTATFINGANWNQVYAYSFAPEENGSWPGQLIEKTGTTLVNDVPCDVYTYSIETDLAPAFIIFNNGSGGEGNQTADLIYDDGKEYGYALPAEISSVEIRGDFNNWGEGQSLMTKNSYKEWQLVIDLTENRNDQEFKLVVNNNWIGNGSGTIINAPAGWVEGLETGNWNYLLKNSATNYGTYTVTATWEPNPDATAKWTLSFAGDIPTGIREVESMKEGAGDIIYDLQGQSYTSNSQLRKGVYIRRSAEGGLQGKAGKKLFIK